MKRRTFLVATLFLELSTVHAQAGSISGKVSDSSNGTAVPFASVEVIGTHQSASADASGHFVVRYVPVGDHTVVTRSMGYLSDTTQVNVSAGKEARLSVSLKDASLNLNELIVTGVTRATLVRKNPIAVSIITPKQIQKTSASNLIDALVENAPGLTALKTGPNVSKPFIHGLGYNRVLTLYDGIRESGQQWGDEHGIAVDDYYIEKAEVIKGPSSLLYGSDALAGVVSLIPFTPYSTDNKLHGQFLSEYQANNGLIGNNLRLDYGGERWAYSLEGSYRIAKNYQNAIDGRVFLTGFRQKTFAASTKYTAKTGYSTLNFNLYDDLQGIPDASRDSVTRKFTEQIYDGDLDNVKDRPLISEKELNSYALSPLHQHIQNYRLYNKDHYKIGNGAIDAYWALQHNIRREYNHATFPDQAGTYLKMNTADYDVRYDLPEFANTSISVGVNGMFQNSRNAQAEDVLPNGGASAFPIPNYDLFTLGSYVYGKWQYERWTIAGGIRYDRRSQHGDDLYTREDPVTGITKQVSPSDTMGADLPYPSFAFRSHGVSGSLGTTVQLNEHINLKANIARGYRAPNINELASNGLNPGAHIIYTGNRDLQAEFSLQEDVGLGFRYRNVSGDLSVYNNNISNFIFLSQLVGENGQPIIDNHGNRSFGFEQSPAQIYGMDVSLSIHPEAWKGFSFDNSVSLSYGFNHSPRFDNKGNEGEYLPRIPPMQLNSGIRQKVDLRSKVFSGFSLKVSSTYSSEQDRYLALNNTESFTPSYVLFNFAVNADVQCSKEFNFHVSLGVNNIFDTAYQTALSRLKYFEYYTASPNGHLGVYDMGRNISLKVIVPF